jgi:hypothetical protein
MAKWGAESKKRQYNHASTQLKALKRQLRMYIIECKFDEAEEVKVLMTRTQEAEQADACKQMQHDFEEAQQRLKAKQAAELAFADESGALQIVQLRQKRGWGRQTFLNKKRKFEKRAGQISDAERLWNWHQAQRKDELARGGQAEGLSRTTKLSESDIPAEGDSFIPLTPLRMSSTI